MHIGQHISLYVPPQTKLDIATVLTACLKRMRVSDANTCGRCHREFYCSRECQVKDYPSHKKVCYHDAAESSFMNNEIKLFYKWYDSGECADVMELSTHAMTRQQFLQKPLTYAVEMKFRFNPKQICDFPDAQEIQRRIDMYQKPLGEHELGHMIAVTLIPSSSSGPSLGAVKYRHQVFKPTDYRRRSFQKALNEFRYDFDVCPKLKAAWHPRLRTSLDQQLLEFCSRNDDTWETFLACAYHLYCDRPYVDSHVLAVYFVFGENLGEIEKLTRFEILTIKEARKKFGGDIIDHMAKK